MLEETINFCQTNPSSVVRDIRFAVFQQNQALTTAFAQEVATLQSKYSVGPGYTMGGPVHQVFPPFRFLCSGGRVGGRA